jgi:ammonia channel protein AmtB
MSMQTRIKVFKKDYKDLEKLSERKIEHLIKTYDKNLNEKFQYSSMQHIVIGGLILWLSWFFFNGSCGISITEMS